MNDDARPMSRDAQRLLDALSQQMAPTDAEGAKAFDRLVEAIAAPAAVRWWTRGLRSARRTWTHLRRIAVPVLVIAATLAFFRSIASDEIGEAAGLQNARMMLDAQRYRGAYRALAEHAKRFPSRRAAESRMPLVLDALCGMEAPQRAEQHLERFLAQVPDSALAARRREICPLGTQPAQRLQESFTAGGG